MNIVLIGMRGSGKSTIARRLASALGRTAIDMDDRVLAHLAAPSVARAWESVGQSGWRAAECEILDDLLDGDDHVVASGGGVVVTRRCRQALDRARERRTAIVVYLACNPAALRQRLQGEMDDRPSLTGAETLAEIETVATRREPWYQYCADHVIDVSNLSQEQTTAWILEHVL